jgi:hypothetical protein
MTLLNELVEAAYNVKFSNKIKSMVNVARHTMMEIAPCRIAERLGRGRHGVAEHLGLLSPHVAQCQRQQGRV